MDGIPDKIAKSCPSSLLCRFFPTNGPQADKNGNTRPGTVVDKGITGV